MYTPPSSSSSADYDEHDHDDVDDDDDDGGDGVYKRRLRHSKQPQTASVFPADGALLPIRRWHVARRLGRYTGFTRQGVGRTQRVDSSMRRRLRC